MKQRTVKRAGIGCGAFVALFILLVVGARVHKNHWMNSPGPTPTIAALPVGMQGDAEPALLTLIHEWARCYQEYAYDKEKFVATYASLLPLSGESEAIAEDTYDKLRKFGAKPVAFNTMNIRARGNSASVTYNVTWQALFGREFNFAIASMWKKENGEWRMYIPPSQTTKSRSSN